MDRLRSIVEERDIIRQQLQRGLLERIILIEKIKQHDNMGGTVDGSEIPNNQLGCIKPCKYWDELPINWCRIYTFSHYL